MKIIQSGIALLMSCVLLSGICPAISAEQEAPSKAVAYKSKSYYSYSVAHANDDRPTECVSAQLADFSSKSDADVSLGEYEGRENVLVWQNAVGSVELPLYINTAGCYQLKIDYYPILSDSFADLEFEVRIDGGYPFRECAQIVLPRIYRDESYLSSDDNDFATDNRGNDICPTQVQKPRWISHSLRDNTGASKEPFSFYFSEGMHTVSLVSLRSAIAISGISAQNPAQAVPYKSYEKQNDGNDISGFLQVIEAEKPFEKSGSSLYPLTNKSSNSTTPSDPYATRLNTIGGENWSSPLQSITWEFSVPHDGNYKIGMRFRQNFIRGLYTSRSILIDGEQPFAELSDVRFSYSKKWQTELLGEWSFYLTSGRHTITMIPTVSGLEQELQQIDEIVERLDALYRNIIMITGTDPDIYRDYYLDEAISDLMETMQDVSSQLDAISKKIESFSGKSGGVSATLDRVSEQLKGFIKKPDTIPSRISNFQSNISSLASFVLELRAQSLQLDRIFIIGAVDKIPQTEKSFLQSALYAVKEFASSFIGDYTSIGNAYNREDAVYIWLTGSRDTAGVLKNLIDNDFTKKTGIYVNANLSTTSLLSAVMANRGPDVAISVARDEPINLAVRGAVLPLDTMNGFDDVIADFSKEATVAYRFGGHCYALPVTQNFLMMFCRDDVLDELELSPPITWKEFYAVAEVLQRNNMNIGIPDLFTTLLFQMGGSLYNKELTETSLDSNLAYDAFKMYTDFYTQYGIPLYKDDYNRFRTGEFPIVIANYSFYNQVYAAAPEIRNTWSMTEIPGIETQDGTVNRISAASGTACVILSGAKNVNNSWEFVKWWVGGNAQGQYNRQIETMLGVIARGTPANPKAMNLIPWSSAESSVLNSQWANTKETEEIPGSYYTGRNISNAFNSVYYDGSNPREALNVWNAEINSELKRKREEFANAYKS